jgi:hypothetical protein
VPSDDENVVPIFPKHVGDMTIQQLSEFLIDALGDALSLIVRDIVKDEIEVYFNDEDLP